MSVIINQSMKMPTVRDLREMKYPSTATPANVRELVESLAIVADDVRFIDAETSLDEVSVLMAADAIDRIEKAIAWLRELGGLVEPKVEMPGEYTVEDFGDRRLTLRRWKSNRRTMTVEWWHDSTDDGAFAAVLDSGGMNAALYDLCHRCWQQYSRRAHFRHGRTGGYLGRVPHDIGTEAFEIVRAYYTKALTAM